MNANKNVSIKSKTISGIVFKLFERIGTQVIGLVISIVLARLLDPEIVGVVSLAEVFILFFSVIATYGFGNSLIQNKNADEVDYATALYFSIIVSCILYGIIFFAAPVIERFYGYEKYDFANVIRVLGIAVIFSAVKSIQQALVSKKLLFKYFMYAALISIIISGGIGIFIAIRGGGIWSLVIQNTLLEIIYSLVLAFLLKWKPIKAFSIEKLKKIVSFGWKLIVVGVLNVAYLQVRSLIIAKKYTSKDLAYFNRGFKFAKIVPEELGTSLMAVLFPVFSLYDDKEKMKLTMRKSVRVGCFIIFPLLIGMFAVADNMIIVLLTEKWVETTPYVRLFCLSYILYVVEAIINESIKAIGNSGALMKINMVSKGIGVAIILITFNRGVKIMAVGFMISLLIEALISIYVGRKLINYRYTEYFKDIFPALMISILMGVVCYIENYLGMEVLLTLVIQIVSGAIVYVILAKLFNLYGFNFIISELSTLRNKFKGEKNNVE